MSGGDEPTEVRVALRSIMGRLKVTCTTAGAEVSVNNSPRGVAPLELPLAEGIYRVELRKAGHKGASRDVTVSRGQTSIAEFEALEALTGSLNVAYSPTYATVTIDGREAGKTPRVFRNIPAGTHRVTISHPGYLTESRDVSIAEGETSELKGSLKKEGAWRTEGRNLDLAVKRDGRSYFFSTEEWGRLSEADKSAFRKLGIVIDRGGERFLWGLKDEARNINWYDAKKRFGERLPSKGQGEALSIQNKDVNNAILAYGGDDTFRDDGNHTLYYLTKDEYSASQVWEIPMRVNGNTGLTANMGWFGKGDGGDSVRVRLVSAVPKKISDVWRTEGRNLDLAVIRDGRYYFFSTEEWGRLSEAYKSAFRKLGIVIDRGGERFLWGLKDEARNIDRDSAMERYGGRLPSRGMAEALTKQAEAVKEAIRAYGGEEPKSGYWTRDEHRAGSTSWLYFLSNGLLTSNYNASRYCVRTFSLVP